MQTARREIFSDSSFSVSKLIGYFCFILLGLFLVTLAGQDAWAKGQMQGKGALWTSACHSVRLVGIETTPDGRTISTLDSVVNATAISDADVGYAQAGDEIKCKDLSHWTLLLDPSLIDWAATYADPLNEGLVFEPTPSGIKVDTKQSSFTNRTLAVTHEGTLQVGTGYTSKAGPYVTQGTVEFLVGADLNGFISISGGMIQVGQLVEIRAEVLNSGPDSALEVTGDLSLPGFVITDVTTEPGNSTGPTEQGLNVRFGEMPAGTREIVTVRGYATLAGGVSYTFTVSSDTVDPKPDNNDSVLEIDIYPSDGLTIDLGGFPESVFVGDTANLSVKVTNPVFVAANDGFLHAIQRGDGGEEWDTGQITWEGGGDNVTVTRLADGRIEIGPVDLEKEGGTIIITFPTKAVKAGSIEITVDAEFPNYTTVTQTQTVEVVDRPASATIDPVEVPLQVESDISATYVFTVTNTRPEAQNFTFSTTASATLPPPVEELTYSTVTMTKADGTRQELQCTAIDNGNGRECAGSLDPQEIATVEFAIIVVLADGFESGDVTFTTKTTDEAGVPDELVYSVTVTASVAIPEVTIDQYPLAPVQTAACSNYVSGSSDRITFSGTISNPSQDTLLGQLLMVLFHNNIDPQVGKHRILPKFPVFRITNTAGDTQICGSVGQYYPYDYAYFCPGNNNFGAYTFEPGALYTWTVTFEPCIDDVSYPDLNEADIPFQAFVRDAATNVLVIPGSPPVPEIPVTYIRTR